MKKLFLIFAIITMPTITHGAMQFNGTSYVTMGNSSPLSFERTSTWTITCWVNFNSTNTNCQIISKALRTVANTGWSMAFATPGLINLNLRNTAGNAIASNVNLNPIPNVWYHLTWEYIGTSTATGNSLWVNGISRTVNITVSTLTSTIISTAAFNISSRDNGQNPFQGIIDDVRVYNRALSQAEISTLALSQMREIFTDGLVGWWKLDEGLYGALGGSSVIDSSTNKISGTSTLGPVWTSGILNYQ